MKEESKIVELLAEMLKKFDNHDDLLKELIEGQKHNTQEIKKLNASQNKTNISIGELRLSNMRLAESIEHFFKIEERVKKLESAVFNKPG